MDEHLAQGISMAIAHDRERSGAGVRIEPLFKRYLESLSIGPLQAGLRQTFAKRTPLRLHVWVGTRLKKGDDNVGMLVRVCHHHDRERRRRSDVSIGVRIGPGCKKLTDICATSILPPREDAQQAVQHLPTLVWIVAEDGIHISDPPRHILSLAHLVAIESVGGFGILYPVEVWPSVVDVVP